VGFTRKLRECDLPAGAIEKSRAPYKLSVMVDKDQWLQRIFRAVAHIADRDYQSRSWFGGTTEASSPDEEYNALFDDAMFDEFFEQYSQQLSPSQRGIWSNFKEKLEAYSDSGPDTSDPYAVYDDPRWEDIRACAREFLNTFNARTV
jgi:hypothetical protein